MLQQFVFYIRDLRRFSGRRLGVAAALVGLGAVLEAIGVVALIPLFSLAVSDGSAMSEETREAFRSYGLDSPLLLAILLSLGFLAVIALRAVIFYYRDVYVKRLALEYVDKWRRTVLVAVRDAPWTTLIDQRRVDLEHTILSDVSRLSLGNDQLLRSAAMLAIVVAQMAVLALLSTTMLVFVFGLLGTIYLVGTPILRQAQRHGSENTLRGRGMHQTLSNLLVGIKLARINNAQGAFNKQILEATAEMRENQLTFVRMQSATRGMLQLISALAVAATLFFGFFALSMPQPVLLVVVVIVVRIAGAGQQILQAAQSIANMLPALAALRASIDALGANGQDHALGNHPQSASRPQSAFMSSRPAALSLENIWFGYREGHWTLEDVTVRVEPGELVALNGSSGAGKTTLLDIAAGLLPPERGIVRVDGSPINCPAAWRDWRDQIAYLPQDPFLFDATIGENLRWFRRDADAAAVRMALIIADLETLVDRLPDGLNSRVGERGQTLSGGERQRMCLARALLGSPRLLILDEALNAVDELCAEAILQRIASLEDRPTVLFVTHRRKDWDFVDRVIELAPARPPEVRKARLS